MIPFLWRSVFSGYDVVNVSVDISLAKEREAAIETAFRNEIIRAVLDRPVTVCANDFIPVKIR